MAIIDTHIHIWDLDQAEYEWLKGDTSLLNRTYSIEEFEEERKNAGITKGVLVQAANNFEDTDWMLKVAEKNDWIAGVVGWVPLMDPGKTEEAITRKYTGNAYFKGVRHLIHNESDPQWMLQDAVIESLKILAKHHIPYDVVGINPAHLQTALKVSEKVPDLKMVLDHINQPPISTGEKFGTWGGLMKEAARQNNIYAKISGLGTTSGNFGGWAADDLEPYIEFTLQHFGDDRCFCGGDWPVSLLAGSYTKIWQAYKSILSRLLNEEAREKVFSMNAERFYNL